jgi:hypothetical protein
MGLSAIGRGSRYEEGEHKTIADAADAINAYYAKPSYAINRLGDPIEISGPRGQAVAKKVAFWATEYVKTAVWNGWNSWGQSPILQATGLAPKTTQNTIPVTKPKTYSLDGTVPKSNPVTSFRGVMSDATKKKLPGYGLGPKLKIVGFGR